MNVEVKRKLIARQPSGEMALFPFAHCLIVLLICAML
jgi:hypothetical protein